MFIRGAVLVARTTEQEAVGVRAYAAGAIRWPIPIVEQAAGVGEERPFEADIPRQPPDRELDFEAAAEIGGAAEWVALACEAE